MDNRKIKQRDPAKLDVADLRTLVDWCNNQVESFLTGWADDHVTLTLPAILHLYHACWDAGYDDLGAWHRESWDDGADGAFSTYENAYAKAQAMSRPAL